MDKPYKMRNKHIAQLTIIVGFLLIFTLNIVFFDNNKVENVSFGKENSAYIVMNMDTREVLISNNIHIKLPIASLTKIMTAITVIDEVNDLDKVCVIPKEAVGIEGSSIYLKVGEKLSFRELLYGLMLRSGNDSATALAILTSGSVENFVELMNKKAQYLGLQNSKFCNPHGLDTDGHYSSAYDLAIISSYAMQNDEFLSIVSSKFVVISGEPKRYLKNKNKMLTMYDGANGIKTGYTKKAGRCLVSSARRNGVNLVSVVLNVPDMWNVSINNLDKAFANYS